MDVRGTNCPCSFRLPVTLTPDDEADKPLWVEYEHAYESIYIRPSNIRLVLIRHMQFGVTIS